MLLAAWPRSAVELELEQPRAEDPRSELRLADAERRLEAAGARPPGGQGDAVQAARARRAARAPRRVRAAVAWRAALRDAGSARCGARPSTLRADALLGAEQCLAKYRRRGRRSRVFLGTGPAARSWRAHGAVGAVARVATRAFAAELGADDDELSPGRDAR